jgi:alpha-D-ribose 1-methylphosphonate 5-triphosphate synthase subunit PhnH
MVTVTDGARRLTAGFSDPVGGAQSVFRQVLEAMANPGRIIADLDGPAETPAPLTRGSAAVCLALLDYETPLWLGPSTAGGDAEDYLRFHTGAPVVAVPGDAAFAVIDGARPALADFRLGSDQYPEEGATLVIQVTDLRTTGDLELTGPGIDGRATLGIDGLDDAFWRERAALARLFPRGLDMIFTAGSRIAALPRGTTIHGVQADRDIPET